MLEKLLQRWHLVGLLPMHDAMVRRLVHEQCDLVAQERQREISIAWSTSDHLESWSAWSRAVDWDVVIVAVDPLLSLIEKSFTTSQTRLLGTENRNGLRLVWSGIHGGQNNFGWVTEYLANGVIVDPQSLQSWIRIAISKAHSIAKPPHPFLRDLEIPSV